MEFTRTTRGRRDLRTTSSLRSRRCGAVPTFSVPAQKDTTDMKKNVAPFVLLAASIAAQAAAQERRPADIPRQDHIFVVLMENHGYRQIINNPNEPFLNGLIAKGKVSLARNYFAVGHPSLTNYLEIVGGSNFGVRSDNPPNWGNANCVPNIQSRLVNADSTIPAPPGVQVDPDSAVCPIAGIGMDAATPAVDTWNEVAPGVFNFLADIDGVKSVPAARTVGETIADQLVRVHKNWKSYQETLPIRICIWRELQQWHGNQPDQLCHACAADVGECRAGLRGQTQSLRVLQERARRKRGRQQPGQRRRIRRRAWLLCRPGQRRRPEPGVRRAESVQRSTRAR